MLIFGADYDIYLQETFTKMIYKFIQRHLDWIEYNKRDITYDPDKGELKQKNRDGEKKPVVIYEESGNLWENAPEEKRKTMPRSVVVTTGPRICVYSVIYFLAFEKFMPREMRTYFVDGDMGNLKFNNLRFIKKEDLKYI